MKVVRFTRGNALYGEVMLVVLVGLASSVGIVTLGYVVISQLFR